MTASQRKLKRQCYWPFLHLKISIKQCNELIHNPAKATKVQESMVTERRLDKCTKNLAKTIGRDGSTCSDFMEDHKIYERCLQLLTASLYLSTQLTELSEIIKNKIRDSEAPQLSTQTKQDVNVWKNTTNCKKIKHKSHMRRGTSAANKKKTTSRNQALRPNVHQEKSSRFTSTVLSLETESITTRRKINSD